MFKRLKAPIFLLILLSTVFVGCTQKTDSTYVNVTPELRASIGDTDSGEVLTTSSTTIKKDFLEYIKSNDANARIGAIDSMIIDNVTVFGDSFIVDPPIYDDENLYKACYVYISENGIILDDVEIRENTSETEEPFIYINDSPEKVSYKAADDAIVYTHIITEEWFYYGFPIDFLEKYLKTTENNLFNVYIKDGIIKSMYEIYLP